MDAFWPVSRKRFWAEDRGPSCPAIRERLRETLGDAALVDAAAVVANYSALDRVADATGIPLEPAKEAATEGLRAELGIDRIRPPAG